MAAGIEFKVDTADAKRLSSDLRTAAGRLPDALHRGVRAAAEPIATGIRAEAAWSTRIPGAVSIQVSGSGVATVTVDPNIAPEAAPLNNRGQSGEFTHPVFGNEWTVQQRARPFITPGARRGQAEADRRVAAMLTQWERNAGFK
jgi:hypothetical protein